MIAQITRAYVRRYRDSGQVTAYVEWIDHRGHAGCTEGNVLLPKYALNPRRGDPTLCDVYGSHLGALFARAICNGLPIEREIW